MLLHVGSELLRRHSTVRSALLAGDGALLGSRGRLLSVVSLVSSHRYLLFMKGAVAPVMCLGQTELRLHGSGLGSDLDRLRTTRTLAALGVIGELLHLNRRIAAWTDLCAHSCS